MQLSVKRGPKNSADILIYDAIGPEDWGLVSAKAISKELDALGAVDQINVGINSPGGYVFEGLAIYNLLHGHPAAVTVDIHGAALSIASIIAMAGDKIRIAESAMMMIHDPWGMVAGNAAELRKEADILDQLKGSLVGIYAARTGMDNQQLADMMTAETWLQADQALASKFVDEITPNKQAVNAVDLSKFKNVPQWASKAAAPPSESKEIPWRRNLAERRLELLRQGF